MGVSILLNRLSIMLNIRRAYAGIFEHNAGICSIMLKYARNMLGICSAYAGICSSMLKYAGIVSEPPLTWPGTQRPPDPQKAPAHAGVPVVAPVRPGQ